MLQSGQTHRGLESCKKFVSPDSARRRLPESDVYKHKPVAGKSFRRDSIYDVR